MALDARRKTAFKFMKPKTKIIQTETDDAHQEPEKSRKSLPAKIFHNVNGRRSSVIQGAQTGIKNILSHMWKGGKHKNHHKKQILKSQEKKSRETTPNISEDKDSAQFTRRASQRYGEKSASRHTIQRQRSSGKFRMASRQSGAGEEQRYLTYSTKVDADDNANEIRRYDHHHNARNHNPHQHQHHRYTRSGFQSYNKDMLTRNSSFRRMDSRTAGSFRHKNSEKEIPQSEKLAVLCQLMLHSKLSSATSFNTINKRSGASTRNSLSSQHSSHHNTELGLDSRYFTYYPCIFNYLRKRELVFKSDSNFLHNSGLTEAFRCLLVDWLIKVQLYTKCWTESLQTSVALCDSYLACTIVKRPRYQLVGIASLLLSCKAVQRAYPRPQQLCFLTEDCYTPQELIQMEAKILEKLEWAVFPVLPHHFLHRTLLACVDILDTTEIESLSKFLLDAILLEPLCHTIKPSCRCAAAVCLSRSILHHPHNSENREVLAPWTRIMQMYTKYSSCHLKPTIRLYIKVLVNLYDEEYAYRAVIQKYSKTAWSSIATSEDVVDFVKRPSRHQQLLTELD